MKRSFIFLKQHFWPHRHNGYQPSALRLPLLFLTVLALLAAQLAVNPRPTSGEVLGVRTSVEVAELLELTNAQRAKAGAAPLALNAQLQAAAKAKLADMFQRDYWAHYAPDGTAPWQFIEDSGYYYETAGENLARNFSTSSGVMTGWMTSPGHRENILKPEYQDMGIAAAKGKISGEPTNVVVALYAAPQPVSVTLLGTGSGGQALPVQTSYSLLNPLSPLATLPALAWVFVAVCSVFAVLYLAQHIIIRNRRLAWDSHVHSHPMLQSAAFGGLAVLLLQSGFGVVG